MKVYVPLTVISAKGKMHGIETAASVEGQHPIAFLAIFETQEEALKMCSDVWELELSSDPRKVTP